MPEILQPKDTSTAVANPATERHFAESACIGLMLLAYGELELMVGNCLGHALGNSDTALRTMFRIMGETSRIQAADALMREFYKKAGLESAYANAIGAVRHCIKIRNQYAHCHWSDYPNYDGLFFTELQDPARSAEDFEYWFLHVNLALLDKQKRFFDYAADYLRFLEYRNQVRTGKMPDGVIQEPTKRAPPSLHNPPDKYIPPWLVGDKRQRHLERFQEQQEGDRLPSAAQLAQEQRRQEKLAKRQADRDRNLAKRSRPDPKK